MPAHDSKFMSLKRSALLSAILTVLCPIAAQEIQEKSIVINVEVPVRVFDGKTFVANLGRADFEILENGKPQDVLACYFMKTDRLKTDEQSESEVPNLQAPIMSRTFILIFEMNAFGRSCRQALSYFVESVLGPEDTLFLATPLRTYRIGPETLAKQDRKSLAQSLQDRAYDDIMEASSELRFLITDYISILEREEGEIAAGRENTLREILVRIRQLKTVDQKRLMELAQSFTKMKGQKHVLIFLEKEDVLVKKVRSTGLDRAEYELFKMELLRDVQFDVERLSQQFAQSLLDFHFIFVTGSEGLDTSLDVQPSRWSEYEKQDITGAFFSVFHKIAEATGGLTLSSRSLLASVKKAVEVADQYYLLYYQPKPYTPDGRFREIEVRVKGRDYTVLHRKGYFATEN